MATTIHEPPQIDPDRLPKQRHSGNGGWRNLVPADGDLHVALDHSPPAVFVRHLCGAFRHYDDVCRVHQRPDCSQRVHRWTGRPLLCRRSSTSTHFCFSPAALPWKSRVAASPLSWAALQTHTESPARWLYVTLFLGLLFVAGQYVAWSQLRAEGLYLATNPSSSFFYVLTATHALHVLGGLGGLIYVIRKLSNSALRRNALDATARYWHFMDILWLYLLFLLWMKL